MPCERKHIEAVRAKIRDLRVEDGLIGGDDRITVLLDAALSACDESPWRSMESAPKDETTVDLWTSAGERLADCHYCVSTGTWKYWLDGRWVHIVSTPTHWMHLPAAPEGKP